MRRRFAIHPPGENSSWQALLQATELDRRTPVGTPPTTEHENLLALLQSANSIANMEMECRTLGYLSLRRAMGHTVENADQLNQLKAILTTMQESENIPQSKVTVNLLADLRAHQDRYVPEFNARTHLAFVLRECIFSSKPEEEHINLRECWPQNMLDELQAFSPEEAKNIATLVAWRATSMLPHSSPVKHCGDLSREDLFQHMGRMRSGENLRLIGLGDHVWFEASNRTGRGSNDVNSDRWCRENAPVLEKDAAVTRTSDQDVELHVKKNSAQMIQSAVMSLWQALMQSETASNIYMNLVEMYKEENNAFNIQKLITSFDNLHKQGFPITEMRGVHAEAPPTLHSEFRANGRKVLSEAEEATFKAIIIDCCKDWGWPAVKAQENADGIYKEAKCIVAEPALRQAIGGTDELDNSLWLLSGNELVEKLYAAKNIQNLQWMLWALKDKLAEDPSYSKKTECVAALCQWWEGRHVPTPVHAQIFDMLTHDRIFSNGVEYDIAIAVLKHLPDLLKHDVLLDENVVNFLETNFSNYAEQEEYRDKFVGPSAENFKKEVLADFHANMNAFRADNPEYDFAAIENQIKSIIDLALKLQEKKENEHLLT